MPRSVDTAMDEERPEKRTIRQLWLDHIVNKYSEYLNENTTDPFYMTLCGAKAKDIGMLLDQNLIGRTEQGGIKETEFAKLVAIESNMQAIAEIKDRYPGLKVVPDNFKNVIRNINMTAYPEGDHYGYCRAKIINLDLNASINGRLEQGQTIFPVIVWVQKLAEIHAKNPQRDWLLYLTLHGQLPQDRSFIDAMLEFIRSNIQDDQGFRESCYTMLGQGLVGKIIHGVHIDLETLSETDHQKILMVYVPKRISDVVAHGGWRLVTRKNLRYGGGCVAPMVSWILEFRWDTKTSHSPRTVYVETLNDIFQESGWIEENGNIQ